MSIWPVSLKLNESFGSLLYNLYILLIKSLQETQFSCDLIISFQQDALRVPSTQSSTNVTESISGKLADLTTHTCPALC